MNSHLMPRNQVHTILNFLFASVWIANGFFCKVLNWVPRHELIVGRILGARYSRTITILIGISEILMAFWIISGFRARLNAVLQIIIIATMNTLEFILAPDLLLWGRGNAIFALFFILLIYANEFYQPKNPAIQSRYD